MGQCAFASLGTGSSALRHHIRGGLLLRRTFPPSRMGQKEFVVMFFTFLSQHVSSKPKEVATSHVEHLKLDVSVDVSAGYHGRHSCVVPQSFSHFRQTTLKVRLKAVGHVLAGTFGIDSFARRQRTSFPKQRTLMKFTAV